MSKDNKKQEKQEETTTPEVESNETEEVKAEGSKDAKKEKKKEESDAEKIVRLEEELKAEKDNALRAHAEMVNFRKRQEKERTTWNNLTIKDIVSAFLDPIDNLERSVEAASTEHNSEEVEGKLSSLSDGVKMVLQQFMEILDRKKVECVDPKGELFDPNVHEAYGQIETDEVEEGHIAAVFRKGYKIGDSLIRTATVQIAKKPTETEDAAQEEKKD
ncbi:MAG: nucleotide exchange factor GrpE [Planctomycetes bacterium]|nr:nucleotide exchange factor GrpE [Planctomycetota bacterium]